MTYPDWKALGLPVKGSGALDVADTLRTPPPQRGRIFRALRLHLGMEAADLERMTGRPAKSWPDVEAGRHALGNAWLLALAYLVLEKHVAQGGGK